MINITPTAAHQVIEVLNNQKSPDKKLRISIVRGENPGLQYKFDFITDKEIKPNDYILEQNGIKVVVDPKSALFLAGMQLDYDNSQNHPGFKINNPKTSTCSCGESIRG